MPSARIGVALVVGLLVMAAAAEVVGEPRLSQLVLLLATLTALATGLRNVIDRKRATKALQLGQEHLRAFFETSTVGMAEVDAATSRFVRVNDAFCQMLGYTQEEILQLTAPETFVPDDIAQASERFHRLRHGKLNSYQAERKYRRKDGTVICALVYAVTIRDPNGEVTRLAGVFIDLTDRKRAEEQVAALNATLERRVAQRTGELADAIKRMASEVEERRRIEERLRASEERFELAVRGSEDGIWDWDLRTNECYFSPRWKQMLGYADDEVAGRIDEWRRLVHPEDLVAAETALHAYFTHENPHYGLEVRMRHKDGSWRWIFTRGAAQWDADGKPARMAGSHTDVTARKLVEEELRQAQAAAVAASRAKSDFLANMSHEIRTPMNGILGMADLALETDLSTKQQEYLRTVKESGESLLRIINDILDVSKVEAGKLELDRAPFRLRETLETAIRPLVVRATQKGLTLTSQVAADVPDSLIGDGGRLSQVLVNLVGNAVKFTERGEVSIAVKRMKADGSGRVAFHHVPPPPVPLQFTVTDTGIGIPANRQQAIFESFAQADNSVTRRYGGTGLGLTISAGLVGLMDGRIWVESEPGAGSQFHFTATFPCSAAEELAETPPPRMDVPGPARSLRVLIAEDQEVNQRLFARMLEVRGHTAVMASTGREALDHLDADTFDAVLMDVQMPEMDGLTATTQLREKEKQTGQRVPVIALTAYAMAEDRERCLAAGCDEYLSKPVRKEDLYRVLEELTGAVGTAPYEAPSFNQNGTPAQEDTDSDFLSELRTLFFDHWPDQLVDLKQAAEEHRTEGVRQIAHSLKGTLAVLGAMEASHAARALQDAAIHGETNVATLIEEMERAVDRFAAELGRVG